MDIVVIGQGHVSQYYKYYHQMSELRCQAAVRLLHVHHFCVGAQNVELAKPDNINSQLSMIHSNSGSFCPDNKSVR